MGADLSPREVIMVFAHAIAKLGPLTQSVGGLIGFAISGARGGRWILDLDAPGGSWSEWGDRALEPATRIDATPDAFSALILNPGRAAEPPSVEGDRQKLADLAALIRSGGSALALRATKNRSFQDETGSKRRIARDRNDLSRSRRHRKTTKGARSKSSED
jgi:hypothetical protein